MSWSVLLLALSLLPVESSRSVPVARLTRLSDPVAWLDGEAQAERPLFHFDKVAVLVAGDGLRQGPHGSSELALTRVFGTIRHFGETRLFVDPADGGGVMLRYEKLRRLHVQSAAAGLTLALPGGTRLRADSAANFQVAMDEFDRRITIRNAGPAEIRIDGPRRPGQVAAVAAGESVELPLLAGALESPALAAGRTWRWQGREVRAEPTLSIVEGGDGLVLSGMGTAVIGGARIRLPAGTSARVWTPHRAR